MRSISSRIAGNAAACFALIALAACNSDKLLDLSTPDIVTPGSVADAAGADALRAGAVELLAIAVAGGSNIGLAPVSGIAADEFYPVASRTGLVVIEQRQNDENNNQGYILIQYQTLQRAREGAVIALRNLKQYAPAATGSQSQMYSFMAYAELMLAENFCSGVTVSDVDATGGTTYGNPMTTTELFNLALAHFDSALAVGKDSARFANLARVGRARTLLDLNRPDEAGAAISGTDSVPTDYVYNLEFSATNSAIQNGVYTWNSAYKIVGISDQRGTNGVDYRSANDPRLPIVDAGIGQDAVTQIFGTTKYFAYDDPVVLADGVEARLIQAEAKLQAGDTPGSLAMLNALRTRVSGLIPLSDAGSPDARLDQLMRERAFWMFGTAHRLGDLRRLVRNYNRSAESVFPAGEFAPGQTYGTQVNLAIPIEERNNPNFSGCIDRAA